MADHRGAPGEGNQSPQRPMEDDTTQQAAASGPVESPECGSSFKPTVDEVVEEAEKMDQSEQVDVDPKILTDLKDVMSKSYKDPLDDEVLTKCITKTPLDLKELLNFFKDVEAQHKKSDKGRKNSEKSVGSKQKGPKIKGEGNQSPQRPMEDDTTQQAAASGPVESPECGSSFKPTVDEVVEEAEKLVQPEQMRRGISEPDKGWNSSWRFWSKSTVKVHSVTTGLTHGADDEILEKVKNMRWSPQVKITDRQQCDIIIVFCPITSRVGSDVPAAMRKAPGNKPVILVLMHHTRDDNYSTDVRKWSDTYQNVKLDVHVLFHETQPGLLKCPRNDEAVQQIQKVLKDHSK